MANLKDTLLRVALNPAVRKATFALVVAVLAALGVSLSTGCMPPTPAQDARFDCRVEALKPSCGAALDASDLVRDFVLGRVDIVGSLMRLGNAPADVQAAIDRYNACGPEAEPAVPEGVVY